MFTNKALSSIVYRLLSFEEIKRNVLFASRMFSASVNKSVILSWAQMETSTGKTALKEAYSCASSAFSFWRYCCLSCYCFLSIYSVLFSFWAKCGIPRSYSIRKKRPLGLLNGITKGWYTAALIHESCAKTCNIGNPLPFYHEKGEKFQEKETLKTMSRNHQAQENI